MSTPWTRVPSDPPPIDPLQLRLLPVADFFMALMLSRPGGLSLRTAWVTPATCWLASLVVLLGGAAGAIAIVIGVTRLSALLVIGGFVGMLIAIGAGTVAVFGIRQRLLARSRPVRG